MKSIMQVGIVEAHHFVEVQIGGGSVGYSIELVIPLCDIKNGAK